MIIEYFLVTCQFLLIRIIFTTYLSRGRVIRVTPTNKGQLNFLSNLADNDVSETGQILVSLKFHVMKDEVKKWTQEYNQFYCCFL